MPSFGSIRSPSTRLKMSDQVSSPATCDAGRARRGGEPVAVALAGLERRQQVDAGEFRERVGDREPLRRSIGIGSAVLPLRCRPPAALAASTRIAAQSAISALVRFVGAIPFQHGEFGMVQRPALAIAEHMGEG